MRTLIAFNHKLQKYLKVFSRTFYILTLDIPYKEEQNIR